MFGLTKEQMQQRFRHDLFLWLISVMIVQIFVIYLLITDYGLFVALEPSIIFLLVFSVGTNGLFALVVFLDWYPDSFYQDLEACPKCDKKALKTVNESRCFACGEVIHHNEQEAEEHE